MERQEYETLYDDLDKLMSNVSGAVGEIENAISGLEDAASELVAIETDYEDKDDFDEVKAYRQSIERLASKLADAIDYAPHIHEAHQVLTPPDEMYGEETK